MQRLGRESLAHVVWQQRETGAPTNRRDRRSNSEENHAGIPISLTRDRLTLDRGADQALRTLTGGAHASRAQPRPPANRALGLRSERRLSGALMRVNHVGEVCAQALYQAQALSARDRDSARSRCSSAARRRGGSPGLDRAQRLARTRRAPQPAQSAVVCRRLRHRPGRRPRRRPLEPGFRRRDRAPGGAAPGRAPRPPAGSATRRRARSSSR